MRQLLAATIAVCCVVVCLSCGSGVPGKDESHATSAARYLQECLPRADYWDIAPADQTEANAPARLLDFLASASRGSASA